MNLTCRFFCRSTMLCLSLAAVLTFANCLPLVAQSTAAKSESKVEPAPRSRVVPPKAQESPKPQAPERRRVGPKDRVQKPVTQATKSDAHDSQQEIMRAWLGVAPVEIEDAVREYLEIPEGFGVSIEYVVEGSPAEKAGLKDKDIVLRLDDQRLTTPRHLQVLVATYKKGDQVELTILRKGHESVVKATLGESELAPLSSLQDEPAEFHVARVAGAPAKSADGSSTVTVQVVPDRAMTWIENLSQAEIQKRIAEYREKMQEWMKQPAATRGASPTLRLHEPAPLPAPKFTRPGTDAVLPLEAPEGKKIEVGSAGVKITGGPSITIGSGASIRASGSSGGVVKINNENGSVSVKSEDGKAVIEVHDANGKLVHSGPYERSADMVDKLPAKAQAVLKKMNLNNLNMLNIQVGK